MPGRPPSSRLESPHRPLAAVQDPTEMSPAKSLLVIGAIFVRDPSAPARASNARPTESQRLPTKSSRGGATGDAQAPARKDEFGPLPLGTCQHIVNSALALRSWLKQRSANIVWAQTGLELWPIRGQHGADIEQMRDDFDRHRPKSAGIGPIWARARPNR